MEKEVSRNERTERQAEQYSPLVLAYIGDAVFELFVRTRLVAAGNMPVNRLHHYASGMVKAEAQSRMIAALEDALTEKEAQIYKRGRNAKSHTTAKNASVSDYRRATGFEAVIGYLYLDGQKSRMLELMERALESEQGKKQHEER